MFMLAGAYAAAGQSPVVLEALNMAFAVATGVIVLDLARRRFGEQAGAAALMLYALWPAGALMVTVSLPHTSYDLAFAAAAWATLTRPPGWQGSALAGAILGLSQYLRPSTFVFAPLFVIVRAIGPGRADSFVRTTLVPLSMAFLLVLLPVMAWHVAERGVPDLTTSAYGGTTLYHGTNPESGGTWSQAGANELREAGGRGAWSRSAAGQRLALERLRDDPLGVAALAIRKQDRLWGHERYGVRYGIRRELATRPYLPRSVLPSLASGAFWTGLAALTALGLWLRRRETDALSAILVGVALLLTLMHGLVEVRDRYHSYVVPLMMPIAALALVSLLERLRAYRSAADPTPSRH
jgi:4-amino-4-deoxy-L-arabinose transferase-like glycosyltransferase